MVDEFFDPWGDELLGKYSAVCEHFGISPIDGDLSAFFKESLHFNRGIVIGHRDLYQIKEKIENKEDFNLVSGFASSGRLHMGHKTIIDVYNYFRKFTKHGTFVICDLDGYVSRSDKKIPSLDAAKKFAINNIANALSLGVPKEDFVVQSKQDIDYFNTSYKLMKKINFNTMKATLGHTNLGKFAAAYLQISDIIYPQVKNGALETLVPVGIDQDPLIRLVRDVYKKIDNKLIKPSAIYVSHLPGLKSPNKKMSKSSSSVSLTTKSDTFKKNIYNALTGGRDNKVDQEKMGGIPEECPIYQMYRFHETDNDFLQNTYSVCTSGKLLCNPDKKILIERFSKFFDNHNNAYRENLKIAKKIMQR